VKPEQEDYCLEESRKPELLKKVERYQTEGLADWDDLGFSVCYGTDPDTPLDGILFAATGGNRIHFAFLTDFGQITDLNEAPIICVAPTYDPPINLVAKNLRQFLTFVAHLQNAEILADIYETETAFEEERQDFILSDNEPERVADREKTLAILKSDFNIHPEPKVFDAIQTAKAERAQQVHTNTIEGLEIILPNDESVTDLKLTKAIQKVKAFLASANLNSRIKIYREATTRYS